MRLNDYKRTLLDVPAYIITSIGYWVIHSPISASRVGLTLNIEPLVLSESLGRIYLGEFVNDKEEHPKAHGLFFNYKRSQTDTRYIQYLLSMSVSTIYLLMKKINF